MSSGGGSDPTEVESKLFAVTESLVGANIAPIIHLGRALGLEVIAEGVETEAQVQALRLAGASHLQGYFFSRPVAPDAALALAEQRFLNQDLVEAGAATGTHG